jgi:hypothetical protein
VTLEQNLHAYFAPNRARASSTRRMRPMLLSRRNLIRSADSLAIAATLVVNVQTPGITYATTGNWDTLRQEARRQA